MTKHKYKLLFIILILFLGIPLISKMAFKGKEIYPSVVLPAGVATLKLDGSDLPFQRSVILGWSIKEKLWAPIDHASFLSPAPVHYLKHIMKNNFGLEEPDPSNKTKKWWRSKLSELGYSDSSFMIRNTKFYIPSNKTEILEEKTYTLYQ